MKRSRKTNVKRNKSKMLSNKSRKSVKRNKSKMRPNKSRKSLKGRKNRTQKNRRRTMRMKGGSGPEEIEILSLTREGRMPRMSSFKLVHGDKIKIPLKYSGEDYFPFNLPEVLYSYSVVPVEFTDIEYWNDLYKKYLGKKSLEEYLDRFPLVSSSGQKVWSNLINNEKAKEEIEIKLGQSLQ